MAAVKAGGSLSRRRYRACTWALPFQSLADIHNFFGQDDRAEVESQLLLWSVFLCTGRRGSEVLPLLAANILGPEVRRLCKESPEPDEVLPVPLTSLLMQILANVKEELKADHPLLAQVVTWDTFMASVVDVASKGGPGNRKRKREANYQADEEDDVDGTEE